MPAPSERSPGRLKGGSVALALALASVAAAEAAPPAAASRSYSKVASIGGPRSERPFRSTLLSIALAPDGRLFALGDGVVRIFDAAGKPVRSWPAPVDAACLTVGPDGRVHLGSPGRVRTFEEDGRAAGELAVAAVGDKPAQVTAVRVAGGFTFVADATARLIRRFDAAGRPAGEIGSQGASPKFMLPGGRLVFDVDARGVVHAADSGRHRVSSWRADGTPLGFFGKFGHQAAEDFVGCCNPVDVAVGPDGLIVTAEKMIARVKVYDAGGRLLAVIGPEHFDPSNTTIPLAVDAQGRIYAADPVRHEILVFAPGGAAVTDDDRSPRRRFLDLSFRTVGFGCLGGAAALLVRRATADTVFQVDSNRCRACDLCRTSCVLSQSAVQAVNDFDKCGYCQLCPAYYDVTSQPDDRGIPTGRVCPQDALRRRVVGKVDADDPNNNYYEYFVDAERCDGCGKCVKACRPPAGNGSLRLEVRFDRCLECNDCAIRVVCPDLAIVRVPTPGQAPPYDALASHEF